MGEKEREADEVESFLADEEQKIKLLKEQLAGRETTLARARAERSEQEALSRELSVELEQLRIQVSTLGEKLGHQMETSQLQFATVGQLEEEIRSTEGEASVLALGLHKADQVYEFLQKEHDLMRQQLQGGYQGSLRDWAEELLSAKASAETERHEDERKHWKQVAEDAKKELRADIEAAKKQHSEAEGILQGKLDSLLGELPQLQQKLNNLSLNQHIPEVAGSVHSVPAPLHGLLEPSRPLKITSAKRRALVIGCNYNGSHAPLQGCTNDAWNLLGLLRLSFGYMEDQVLCFIDGSETCPSPESRQPTKKNIMSGLQWLTSNVAPGDNIAFFFCGYGTQQPLHSVDGLHQAFLVPSDFAADLPSDFTFPSTRKPDVKALAAIPAGCSYRLVALGELTAALSRLPAGCKATLVLDCCHAVVPGVDALRPEPNSFPRVARDLELGDLAALQPNLQPRFLDLPPLTPPLTSAVPGTIECCCHCYSACQSHQWCAELPIEGCIQGALTWAFVKALVAGHLDTSVQQHSKAMHAILADLRHHFRWVEQTPLLQLSGTAKQQDLVLTT